MAYGDPTSCVVGPCLTLNLTVPPEALSDLKPKKRRAKQKTHSLFSVRMLSRKPSDSLPAARTSGWKLEHVVEVTGHFRWQAYGPGRKQRKLIFIEPYERGTGEIKPTITRL